MDNNTPIKQFDLPINRFEKFLNIYKDEDTGLFFYNLLRNIKIESAEDSSLESDYITQYNDTWYNISYKFYNTMDLWWLVCEYNGIKNPTKMLEVGTKLKLLNSNLVWYVVGELQKQISR
jgi:hypothetical protein